MRRVFGSLTAAVALVAWGASAHAADFTTAFPAGKSHTIGIWGQAIAPLYYNYVFEDPDPDDEVCVDEDLDFCEPVVFGAGADARIHHAFADGRAYQIEAQFDYHGSLDSYEEGNEPNSSLFAAFGGHWLQRKGDQAIGFFAGGTAVRPMAGDDVGFHVLSGVEGATFKDSKQYFGQFGGVLSLDGVENGGGGDGSVDLLANLMFVKVGVRHFRDENSMFELAATGGLSFHFDNDSDGHDQALWLQLSAMHERAFEGSNLSWFAGGTVDAIQTDEEGCCDETLFAATALAGVRLNLGGSLMHEAKYGNRTFALPNLSRPISWSGELN